MILRIRGWVQVKLHLQSMTLLDRWISSLRGCVEMNTWFIRLAAT